ncbi:MAG: hypothetical protein J6T05_01790, partial [Prevotella sp.]|nr:hypothetical protein [Prevotella sp.]
MKKLFFILALLLTVMQGAWAQSLPTDGTDAYTIGSKADWETFCTDVNSGNNYNGKTVKLTANVSGVTTMVGSSENNSFQGTFDGGSHTLTFTIGTSQSAFNEQYCALFRYVRNATIQNLQVAGNI